MNEDWGFKKKMKYLLLEVFRVRRCNFSQLFIESKSAWRLVRLEWVK